MQKALKRVAIYPGQSINNLSITLYFYGMCVLLSNPVYSKYWTCTNRNCDQGFESIISRGVSQQALALYKVYLWRGRLCIIITTILLCFPLLLSVSTAWCEEERAWKNHNWSSLQIPLGLCLSVSLCVCLVCLSHMDAGYGFFVGFFCTLRSKVWLLNTIMCCECVF